MSRPLETLTYTVPEVAKVLNLGSTIVRGLIERGDLPAMRVGDRILVSKVALEQWVVTNQRTQFAGITTVAS